MKEFISSVVGFRQQEVMFIYMKDNNNIVILAISKN
ncbi:hypothetical protein Xszus_04352 [Xenorhabdus szentirmaii]|uniref:Uncharacterized protein n=1 Tax=Xenorhabdus ishibashii TaxID=1034471 RepID=A0A2D0K9E0_9GAMM|nr:hypothetical protein Xszus_04352 [Xenorhabdus szentirmaii]PHM59133.1 hypothetical protein Xish_03714 [Xenorhabdus ishibashii]PHM59162.1 hypothetical protein Xish_03693 [Xenorhabdus ishibashii]PHM60031.1 hypothetical protein Xish_03174 [Xenorhabdus ishibashii]PHM60057.1 hypothetical protein Xish_03200 [Xenorhabdus ishibashii]